ncbi:MAG: hypothetical protein E4H09_00720 [Spirochaetales bacterium]|nr:MAG: hypothetical protein E4H09_00720 [Spirochaetales bacterium]
MGDDMFDGDDDVVGAEEKQPGEKRVGFIPGVLIQVLKWAGIILGVIILVVTITVITVNFLSAGNVGQTRVPTSQDYRTDLPILTYYPIEELRGVTADEVRTTFIVEPYLGYDPENTGLTTELIQRDIQLIGVFIDYFGSKTTADLERSENRRRVQQELIDLMNRILREGQIEDLVFKSYQFLPF